MISQENTKTWVEKSPFGNPQVVPNVTYADRMTIGAGDDRVELYYFGVAHTDGDTFVVIPAARAMFLGDIMAWDMAPLIDPPTGGTVIGLPDALELAAETVKGVDTVIGPRMSAATRQARPSRSYSATRSSLRCSARACFPASSTAIHPCRVRT